jgi:hypothetical protein
MNVQVNVGEKLRRWPCAIDMHAHLMIPEMDFDARMRFLFN